ncbi:MAG: beta-eliminating lyase-related protein [Hyphomonadaceae bacterium]|nr:beta-eliminating lyase-related protein [Hyphomonadaceae bacterium]
MDFSSDTSAPAHPKVLEALARANAGNAPSYGADPETAALEARLKTLFETEALSVWPVASGTAANALALACFCPPTSAVLCHREAHIERDERGAPEFFTGGGKLRLLDGPDGRIPAETLAAELAGMDPSFVHETPPALLSLTNLTECGTVYSASEISALSRLAHASGLSVHLDGARFGNALARLGASPAELSWKAGVDVLSFGLTKTGAIGCELIILFGEATARFAELQARAKRAGHMPAKLRYLSAQANALLEGGLWLELAGHANAQATRLAAGLAGLPGAQLRHPVEGNEVFVTLPDSMARTLSDAGAKFYPWPEGGYRFVCSWATPDAAVEQFLSIVYPASR